jgi:hypothetical protein
VVAGEELYFLCKHQKCEHRKGNKQSLQAYSGMNLYNGKLKAEQWRSAIKFDLPVTLIKLWGAGYAGKERRQKLAHSTMLLAMAIRWGTSHVTSLHHAQQYMKTYLECIRDVFPSYPFRPNHHACLHLHEFLLRYGPMHGWWMFPFERIIGSLQKTNTNHKIGEQ